MFCALKNASLVGLVFISWHIQARPFRGFYEVPAGPNNSVDIQTSDRFYPVRFESNTDDPATAQELLLELPAELVGEAYSFTIQKNPQSNEWSGEAVDSARCLQEDVQLPTDDESHPYFSCHLVMRDPPVNLTLVENRLQTAGLTGESLQNRLAVSRQFSDEHIGVLRYRMRGRRGR